MELLDSVPMLLKLDQYCIGEICAFLTTESLLNLWSTNDSRVHALLRQCNAFGQLVLSSSKPSHMVSMLRWAKSLERPRARTLLLQNDFAARPLFVRRLFSICTFEKMEVAGSKHGGTLTLLKKLQELSSSSNKESSLLPGIPSFSVDATSAPVEHALASLPTTLLSFSIRWQWPTGIPILARFSSLASLELEDFHPALLSSDPKRSPAPFFLLGIGTLLPSLTSLSASVPYRAEELPIFEVPPQLAHLSLTPAPLLLWTTSRLESLRLATPFFGSAPVPRKFLLAKCINFLTIKYFCPALTQFDPSFHAHDTEAYSWEAWDELKVHIGETLIDRLLPPGVSPESLFLTSTRLQLSQMPLIASIIYTLPPLITSINSPYSLVDALPSLLTALNSAPLPKLTFLSIRLTKIAFKNLLQLPSTITTLILERHPISSDFVKIVLPPSLTKLQAPFDSLEALIAAREILGQTATINAESVGLALSAQYLSILYPPSSQALPSPTADVNTFNEARNHNFSETALPISAHGIRDLMKSGPYGPYDERDANGDWKATLPGLKNALTRLVGNRTIARFSLTDASEWPESVTDLSINVENFGFGLSLTSSDEVKLAGAENSRVTSLHVSTLPFVPPRALTALRSTTMVFGSAWWHAMPAMPHLTVLELPSALFPLAELTLPAGLRILSIHVSPLMQDYTLRAKLAHLKSLEKATLHAHGIGFTGSTWSSPSLSFADLPIWLESYLRPNATAKIIISDIEGLMVDVSQLTQTLTSLNLLLRLELPSTLRHENSWNHVSCVLNLSKLSPLESFSKLTDLCLQVWPQEDFDLPNFPPCLESLCVIPAKMQFAKPHIKPRKIPFNLLVPTHSCAPRLHTLVAPSIHLDELLPATLSDPHSPQDILPNLTRLAISAQSCYDTGIHLMLQSYFPKLKRLTLTGYVRFTGQLVEQSSSLTVSFESLFRDTRAALVGVLESRERKSANKQRSSDPSDLEKDESNFKTSSRPPTTAPLPNIPASRLPTATDPSSPEVNVAFIAAAPVPHNLPTNLVIPSDSTHVSLRCNRTAASGTIQTLNYSALDASSADWVEDRVREAIEVLSLNISDFFAWSSISNAMALNRLVDIEYDSIVPYQPGDYFQYPSLQRLKIHAPIAEIDDADTLKYSVWKVPSSLTHLVVTRAMRSFTFTSADDSKDLQLSTLELPQAIWQSEDCVPSSLCKLVVMDCNPRSLSRDLESRGCEVVFE